MLKQAIEGVLVGATSTHYITEDALGRSLWHKDYYRVVQEFEPQTERPADRRQGEVNEKVTELQKRLARTLMFGHDAAVMSHIHPAPTMPSSEEKPFDWKEEWENRPRLRDYLPWKKRKKEMEA